MELSEKKKLGLFDITNNINLKTGLLSLEEIKESYSPFIINKAFSQTKDTIFYANEMNCNGNIPIDMQYDFYYHLIPKKKRFGKWNKKDSTDEELINIIQEVYEYSYIKAQEVLPILKQYETELRKSLEKGGVQKQKRK